MSRKDRQRRTDDAVHRAESLLAKVLSQLDSRLDKLRGDDKRKAHSFEEEWEPGTDDKEEPTK